MPRRLTLALVAAALVGCSHSMGIPSVPLTLTPNPVVLTTVAGVRSAVGATVSGGSGGTTLLVRATTDDQTAERTVPASR